MFIAAFSFEARMFRATFADPMPAARSLSSPRLLHLDTEMLCGLPDVGERELALLIAHILHLIEPSDRVADVRCVRHRLFPRRGKGERAVRQRIDPRGIELAMLLRTRRSPSRRYHVAPSFAVPIAQANSLKESRVRAEGKVVRATQKALLPSEMPRQQGLRMGRLGIEPRTY